VAAAVVGHLLLAQLVKTLEQALEAQALHLLFLERQ
jgi:hypothetical protein